MAKTKEPSTFAEYKAKEDRAKSAFAAYSFPRLRLAVPSTPKELLRVFFNARYQGRSKADILKLVEQAYQEPEPQAEAEAAGA